MIRLLIYSPTQFSSHTCSAINQPTTHHIHTNTTTTTTTTATNNNRNKSNDNNNNKNNKNNNNSNNKSMNAGSNPEGLSEFRCAYFPPATHTQTRTNTQKPPPKQQWHDIKWHAISASYPSRRVLVPPSYIQRRSLNLNRNLNHETQTTGFRYHPLLLLDRVRVPNLRYAKPSSPYPVNATESFILHTSCT